jgi:hypothetical protein
MSQIIYPKCNDTFKKWLCSNKNYLEFYNRLNIRIFDVSLRDGLQTIRLDDHHKYTTKAKLQIYNEIIDKHNPDYIELGSIVSKKILPIFADSLEIYGKTWNPHHKSI